MPKQTPLAEPPTKQSVHSFENTEDSFERGIRPVEFAGADRITHRGFMVEKRTRQVLPNEEATVLAETSYVTVSNNGNLLQTFDSGLVYPLGVQAEVAVFPFTTGKSIQLFLSQDVPRGGCQWVIDLDKEMRVIFDGKEFRVGREASDFSVVDFDHDGNYEILVFLTDFYKLHDKMSMALIPLLTIIFRYDTISKKYFPANPDFAKYMLPTMIRGELEDVSNPEQHRSNVLHVMLDYIFAGRRSEGWQLFDSYYSLSDKAEVRRRIKLILNEHPVYKFIYNNRKNK